MTTKANDNLTHPSWMLLPLLLTLLLASCSAAQFEAALTGVAAGLAAASSTGPAAAPGLKLMIFSGPGHDTYLGCLSCPEHAADSIFNEYGTFGSSYSADSVLNPYGHYGSAYSSYSACNAYASDPPVIVDEKGGFHGRLTLNRYHPQANTDPRVIAWLKSVCP